MLTSRTPRRNSPPVISLSPTDQNNAEYEKCSSRQSDWVRRSLRDAQQPKVVEHQRPKHLTNDNQCKHRGRAEARHHQDCCANEDRAEDAARP